MANYGTRYVKKKTPWLAFALMLIVFLILGYLISGVYVAPKELKGDYNAQLLWAFTHPIKAANSKSPAWVGIGFIAWFFFVNYYMIHYRNFHSEMEHGDEDWLDPVKASRELKDSDDKYNRILSENVKVSIRGKLSNNNMMIVGSSGSFKTTSIMHQNLLQMGSSYVVLDVKGDTQRKLGKIFEKNGYQIYSLNFKNPEQSDRYNPFEWIQTEADMLRIIKSWHDAVRPAKENSATDPFWDDAVDLKMQAVFYYAWLDARDNNRKATFNDVISLLAMENVKTTDITGEESNALADLMEKCESEHDANYPPVRAFKKFQGKASETEGSVSLMISAMLNICETAEVKRIFSGNDIDIRTIGQQPTVVFLVMPDNVNTYTWITSMFYTQMFDTLIRLSDDEIKGPLPYEVQVWMDEFYAGARPADTEKLLGVIRSRNISMVPILQSIAQAKAIYPNEKWEIMMDNMAAVVFLGSGPQAKSTHEYISETLGNATADKRDDRMSFGVNSSSDLSYSKAELKLMTPGQVRRMPPTECIIFLESRPPIYDTKAIPFDKPEYGFTAADWLKDRYSAAMALGDYEHPVRTIYDAKNFRYITLSRDKCLDFVTDREEIERLKVMAKTDRTIYSCEVDERDLLYLSFDSARKRSVDEIAELYRQAVKESEEEVEQIKGLALLHDVLVVLTFYAISRISVGNTFIACMLTIVGYSINATIVIFDRIRENLHGSKRVDELEEVVNKSITQTLTRSIYTSLTTFIMVAVLYIMGVSSIREFAAPLMVGIICGAYSSVCITGALWLVMKKKIGGGQAQTVKTTAGAAPVKQSASSAKAPSAPAANGQTQPKKKNRKRVQERLAAQEAAKNTENGSSEEDR